MILTTKAFPDGGRIPEHYAVGKPDPDTHVTFASNQNPDLAWSELPAGTRSLVVLCIDPDAPSVGDDVNQEGKTVAADLARTDFTHWVLVDLDPASGPIEVGEFSDGVIAGGKDGPEGPRGTRQGINDYTGWFASDADMAGDYFGYDGPCPPWNDPRVHRYVFTLYALDIPKLPVDGRFTAADVKAAMAGHVLAEASVSGVYSLFKD